MESTELVRGVLIFEKTGTGGVASMVKDNVCDTGELFPAASMAMTEKSCFPSSRVAVVNDHAPLALAKVFPSNLLPSIMAKVELASALPTRVMVESEVRLAPCAPVLSLNESI